MSATKHSVMAEGVEKIYFDFLEAENWKIQYCQSCDHHIFYPRQYCPGCGAAELNWVSPSGLGTVYSISRVHNHKEPTKAHDVLLVDLDEGVRMMSCAVPSDAKPLAIGSRVTAKIDQFNGAKRIVFQAVED